MRAKLKSSDSRVLWEKSETIKVLILVIVLVVVIVGVETSFDYKNVYIIVRKGMASSRLMRMNAKTLQH